MVNAGKFEVLAEQSLWESSLQPTSSAMPLHVSTVDVDVDVEVDVDVLVVVEVMVDVVVDVDVLVEVGAGVGRSVTIDGICSGVKKVFVFGKVMIPVAKSISAVLRTLVGLLAEGGPSK